MSAPSPHRLGGDARVVYAEPNYLRQPHTLDSRLWAFHNPGGLTITYTQGRNKGQVVSSFVSTADADEDAAGSDVAADYGAGGAAVVISSIDTGVDFAHTEFLSGQLIAGRDWYNNDDDPSDDDGHGTHTTGTMVGRTVGVAGVSGAGPNVKVLVQKVCGPMGCPLSAIANAIRAAADHPGMVAMNLSLGGSSLSQGEKDAIAYATGKGVLVIASAGNNSTGTVSCPACDPNAISVAATNWQDGLAYYSSWGPGLDLSAPGGQLYSNTTQEGGIYSAVVGGYAYYQGTSMAAPQVTGTAAVVASKAGLRGAALRSRLESTADDIGASGYDETFGNGRLNSYRAVIGSSSGGGGGSGGGTALVASISKSCSGATCTFTGSATGGTPDYSYAWADGQGWTDSGKSVRRTFSAAGSYQINLTVTDATSATATATTSVSCSVRGKNLKCQ